MHINVRGHASLALVIQATFSLVSVQGGSQVGTTLQHKQSACATRACAYYGRYIKANSSPPQGSTIMEQSTELKRPPSSIPGLTL